MEKFRAKIVTFCITLFLIWCNHFALAQNDSSRTLISIFSKNKPLRKVIQEIARQSKAKFVFSDSLVEGKTITCNFINLPLEKTLNQIVTQAKISFKILPGKLIVFFNEKSSNQNIAANITDTRFITPTLQKRIEPDYPHLAQMAGLEGSVDVNLLITQKGKVKIAKVIRSSGYKILDNAAVDFARKLQFIPAKKKGKPIEVWVSWTMKYRLAKKSTK